MPDPGDGYTDWQAVYQDNATWVYRTMFARVGNQAEEPDEPIDSGALFDEGAAPDESA